MKGLAQLFIIVLSRFGIKKERYLTLLFNVWLSIYKEREWKMHEDKLMDKVKDGFEKTGEKMKEGFEKAKDFAGDAMENVKDKFKEGGEKLNDMKDNIVDAAQTPGEQLNEQLCDSLDGTDDENKICLLYTSPSPRDM